MKNNNYNNWYIITGGPGVGKTTLLEELKKEGYKVIPEDARAIIQQQLATDGNGLPWKDKHLYADLMLEASLNTYRKVALAKADEILFFDRGIPDTVCYRNMEGLEITKEIDQLVRNHTYHPKVFILPPWKEIYTTDTERKQTWKEAEATFDKMKETYIRYGYEIIIVPKGSVSERKNYILLQIQSQKK